MNFLLQPWPWYVTGPLIGLMVPVLLVFGNKHFGISSTMRHICAACVPAKNPFFDYNWKKEMWSIFLAMGIVLGGWIGHNLLTGYGRMHISKEAFEMFSSYRILPTHDEGCIVGIKDNPSLTQLMPTRFFSFDKFNLTNVDYGKYFGWIFIVLGGFLVGFGTRWANGCTSGHAIMGLSLLNPGSLVAVIGFFIGGLTVSWFVIPYLLV